MYTIQPDYIQGKEEKKKQSNQTDTQYSAMKPTPPAGNAQNATSPALATPNGGNSTTKQRTPSKSPEQQPHAPTPKPWPYWQQASTNKWSPT
jgi:hypothetical protein